MIDISQIVSSAPAKADVSRPSPTPATDASNAFGDALVRARGADANDAQAKRQQDSQDTSSSTPANAAAAAQPAQSGTPGAGKTADKDTAKADDTDPTAADPSAAAAALAALLAMPAQNPMQSAGQTAASEAAGQPAGGTAALLADAGAAVASGQADANRSNTATTPDNAFAAETLATIATQRAALQGKAAVSTAAVVQAKDADTMTSSDDRDAAPDATNAPNAANAVDTALKAALAAAKGREDAAGQPGHGDQPQDQQRAASSLRQTASTLDDTMAQQGNPAAQITQAPAATALARLADAGVQATATDQDAVAAALAASTMAAGQAPTSAGLSAAASPPISLPIAPPVGDGQWPQALSQQMVRLSTQGNHTAELQLNPPDLGPLKVVLNVVNDQVQAQFVSPHQAVRAAVEAAMPHLRTALADNGIQLGQTSVGADSAFSQASQGQQQRQPGGHAGAFAQATQVSAQPEAVASTAPVRSATRVSGLGEVDTFA